MLDLLKEQETVRDHDLEGSGDMPHALNPFDTLPFLAFGVAVLLTALIAWCGSRRPSADRGRRALRRARRIGAHASTTDAHWLSVRGARL
jgi:hypothetical protein